jgi:L-asparaginase
VLSLMDDLIARDLEIFGILKIYTCLIREDFANPAISMELSKSHGQEIQYSLDKILDFYWENLPISTKNVISEIACIDNHMVLMVSRQAKSDEVLVKTVIEYFTRSESMKFLQNVHRIRCLPMSSKLQIISHWFFVDDFTDIINQECIAVFIDLVLLHGYYPNLSCVSSLVVKIPTILNSNRKKVLVLYHGGTAGMQPDETGSLRPVRGYLNEALNKIDELIERDDMPLFDVFEFEEIVDSSDVSSHDWSLMCKQIEISYFQYDGFVIIHGTDTMAYSASSLSFMLENLAKPVIFTGAQLPFGEVHSDARRNIGVSIMIAGLCDIPEVCIFFNEKLYRGNRSVKIDSVSISAFDSPNFPPLAILGTSIELKRDLIQTAPKGKFVVHTNMDNNILVLRLVPGFVDLDSLAHGVLKGVVLLLYGTGNAPGRRESLLNWVQKLVDSSVHVVIVSQCMKGRVDLLKYAVGRKLYESGVIAGNDMTCESAVAKLSYLLGRNDLSHEQIRIAMQQNLRGELTEINEQDEIFKNSAGILTRL